ncbi:hypothetical protein DRW03_15605 [Corallococcus sp. H22C18031201]|nr:hypothetical protein DRW03_15605 [Corallococcus sp. H22C18031201]
MRGSAQAGLRPRAHLHRGTVSARALWFDPRLLGEAEARRRVLAVWEPGAVVLQVAEGYLLQWETSRTMDCAQALGLPLTWEEGVLLSVPLLPQERASLRVSSEAVVLASAGVANVHALSEARLVHPAEWLDVAGWQQMAVEGLGAPPPQVPHLELRPAPTRESFGPGLPGLAKEAEQLLAGTRGTPTAHAGTLARTNGAGAGSVARRAFWGAMAGLLRGLTRGTRWVRAKRALAQGPRGAQAGRQALRAGDRKGAPQRGAATGPKRSVTEVEPTQPGDVTAVPRIRWFERISDWLMRHTPLGPLLGERKAAYVRNLLGLFESGQLDEALRYAIPLGGESKQPVPLSLGTPAPRADLRIQPKPDTGSGQDFGGGPELHALLKQRYREAFTRLEREGRIEEAAFVLTELLSAHEEAVSFLERHGRFKLAAEVAEGHQLAPGLVVRQWFLAKDLTRAVAVARRSGAFGDAVMRLGRTHPAESESLRLLWADSLAESGDWEQAIRVARFLPDARALVARWLELGSDLGGPPGARLLALRAVFSPEDFERTRERVRALLEDEDPDRAWERLAFASALEDAGPASEMRDALLGPTVRALLRERAPGPSGAAVAVVNSLLEERALVAMRTDLPRLREGSTSSSPWYDAATVASRTLRVTERERGLYPVHDVAVLPGNRLLLALGEAGVRLVDRTGQRLAHFDVPASRLVVALQGHRALALARRGDLMRVSRVDLSRRQASTWCDTQLHAWSSLYDGDRWFVAVADTVLMLDALADAPRALWRVTDVGGRVLGLEADAERMSFIASGERPSRWSYALAAGPTLRARTEMALQEPPLVVSLTPDGEGSIHCVGSSTPAWVAPAQGRSLRSPSQFSPKLSALWLGTNWRAEQLDLSAQETQVRLTNLRGRVCAWLSFEGAERVRVRLSADALVCFDELGRVVWLNLQTGALSRVPVR